MTYRTVSADDTRAFAQSPAAVLKAGDTVLLDGYIGGDGIALVERSENAQPEP